MKKVVKVLLIILIIFVALIIINAIRNHMIFKELQRNFKGNHNLTSYFVGKNTKNENQDSCRSIFAANNKFFLVDYNNGTTIYKYYDSNEGILREYKDFKEKTKTEKLVDSSEMEHWRYGNVIEGCKSQGFGPFMWCTKTISESQREVYKVRKIGDNANYDLYDVLTGAKIEKVRNNKTDYSINLVFYEDNTSAINFEVMRLERDKNYKLVK